MSPITLPLFLASLGVAAFGEQPAGAAPGESNGEIVVTAQRRPESPEKVPISLSAISGERLEQMQATDMAGLGKVAPSLIMMRTGAFTQPYLRGVGKRSTLGVENSVATYVDGVYLASSISALLDLRGIERVEVLNGPQGTLFGRNATGGVIQVITRDPSAESTAKAELHLGSYGYVRGDAYLTGGNDRLAANLAMSLSRNDGYGRNLFTGKSDQGEVDHRLVARSKWLWRAADPVSVTLAMDYQDVDQDFSQRPLSGYPPVGAPRVQGFRDGDQDASNRYSFSYGGVSVKTDAEIGNLAFMSLSAVRRMHARYATDLDQGPHPLLSAAHTANQKQFSQEFQLQPDKSRPVQWVAGLYYIHIEERYAPNLFRYGGSYSSRLGGRVLQTMSDRGKISSYAAYGQATLPIGGHMRLTTGLRYTIENRSIRARGEQLYDAPPFVRTIPGLPLLAQQPLSNGQSFDRLTWRVSLDRKFSDALMGYLSSSRGFQSGGWNLQTPQSPAFGPETLDSFEGGLKFFNRSRHLKIDASIFNYDYSDLQVSAFTPLGSVTTNAASAEIYGMELQIDMRLGARTGIAFGTQFLKTRFHRFPNATCTNYSANSSGLFAPISCDVTGNRLPFAPRLKFNLGGNHAFSLGENGDLVLSGNLAYNSGYFSETDNVVRQHAFATVDISGEWQPRDRQPSVRLWVTNLTDAHYYESLAIFPTAGVLQRPAAPRRFGISITQTF